jgi:SnoaL-like domain
VVKSGSLFDARKRTFGCPNFKHTQDSAGQAISPKVESFTRQPEFDHMVYTAYTTKKGVTAMRKFRSFIPMISAGLLAALTISIHQPAKAGNTKSARQAIHQLKERTMNEAEVLVFVTRFEQAWTSRRDEDFVAIWHPDGNLVYPFASRIIKGRELPILNAITKQNAPNLTWKMLNWTHRGNVVVVEWESSNVYGEHVVTWRGVDKLTLRDGKIEEEVVYADTAPFHAMRRGEKFPALIPFPDL